MPDMRNVKAEIRRRRLAQLVGDNQAAFAARIERTAPFVNSLLKDQRKSFGEKLARDLEKRLGLGVGWLDSDEYGTTPPTPAKVTERAQLWGFEITAEGAQVAREWQKLEPDVRLLIQSLIETLVAQSKRDGRKKKATGKPDSSAVRPAGPA